MTACLLYTSNLVEGIQVVGEAADGEEAVVQFRSHHPDVTLIDLRLPKLSGVEVIQRVRSETPQARFVVPVSYTHLHSSRSPEAASTS